MKFVVFSDSHGSSRNMERIVDLHFDTSDGFFFLGDGCREFLRLASLCPGKSFFCVRGNCDPQTEDDIPADRILTFENKRLFLTHGHRYGVKSGLEALISHGAQIQADVLLYGHTHSPLSLYEASPSHPMDILCPGSISAPAAGVPTYGILQLLPSGILTSVCEVQ